MLAVLLLRRACSGVVGHQWDDVLLCACNIHRLWTNPGLSKAQGTPTVARQPSSSSSDKCPFEPCWLPTGCSGPAWTM